jgi:hypothetical protein
MEQLSQLQATVQNLQDQLQQRVLLADTDKREALRELRGIRDEDYVYSVCIYLFFNLHDDFESF